MTVVKPLQAVIYDPDKVGNMAAVVCPPYDVISPRQQQEYFDTDPHNFIHILLGKEVPGEDKYARAQNDFHDWTKQGVFKQDGRPAIYFYAQTYNIKGEKKTRMGFIALLRLEDNNAAVFKHEHTRAEPKEDRLKLIRQVQANLSPIFAIFSDRNRVIQRTFRAHIQNKKPFFDITDRENVRHKLWKLDDEEVLGFISRNMSDENIFIADGHHRYEVACIYREEMKKKLGALSGEEGFNYILTYFTNTDARGLTIFPINRLVRVSEAFDFDKFKPAVSEYFGLEEVKDRGRFFFLMQKAAGAEHVIGMYRQKKFWLLRLKNVKILDKLIADKPKDYRALDVSILNYILFKKVLGFDIEDKRKIAYEHDNEELIAQADRADNSLAFFLNPVRIEQIMSVALSGEKMPSKSTFFYPKVLSGLVIHRF